MLVSLHPDIICRCPARLLPRHAEAKRAVAGKDIYMKRRKFLKVAAVSAAVAPAATGASSTSNQAIQATDLKRPVETVRGEMRYRQLGRTGEEVSIIGLGGHHIGRQKEEKDSIAIIRTAIDAGINFLDNCWDYHDGGSEVRMGKALADGYRRKAFLMTKIDGRTKKAASQVRILHMVKEADRTCMHTNYWHHLVS